MGRGRGGYVGKQALYMDTAGETVGDRHAIFVAERYMDMGYEAVFRRRRPPDKSYDLTIKSSDDNEYIKNIEVKGVTSYNPSQMAIDIRRAFGQFDPGYEDTVAIFLLNFRNNEAGRKFAKEGFNEAVRKGNVKGHVEVWFSDRTKIVFC